MATTDCENCAGCEDWTGCERRDSDLEPDIQSVETARRERYDSAIKGALPLANKAVDAAMAVADAEIQRERADLARALRFESAKVGEQMIELARLRDDAAEAELARQQSDEEIIRLRAELADMAKAAQGAIAEAKERHADAMAQRATIERVRAVLDSEQGCQDTLHHSEQSPPCSMCGRDLLSLLRAALEGDSE